MTDTVIAVVVNGDDRELREGSTVASLVAQWTDTDRGVAVAVNETVVPRGAWSGTVLAPGDRVELLTAVQGG